jgi:mRNA-degrading endonuclease YafQ of YafQ-DinJ toxin-antitoxin module
MKVVFSKKFAALYADLTQELQGRVDKTIRLLASKEASKPFHPSLRAKHVQGTPDIWEASVNMQYRLTFQMHEGTIYLRVVGDHDEALKRP